MKVMIFDGNYGTIRERINQWLTEGEGKGKEVKFITQSINHEDGITISIFYLD